MIDYPTEEEIEELNKEILRTIKARKADTHRVIRRGAIEQAIKAAIADPGDLYDKAATLLIMLVQGHPFDSGNRRTAFAASMAFLRLNGEKARVIHDARVLQGIREAFYTKDEVKQWLKGHEIRAFRR